jgi:hypothetical protein
MLNCPFANRGLQMSRSAPEQGTSSCTELMAVDESFKRPGTIPFKWEVQPGIPKQDPAAGYRGTTAVTLPPRLALPPAARVASSASCRRRSSDASAMPPPPSHRRSMSARFATSLVLTFARRGRTKDDADFCLLYRQTKNIA